MQEPCQHAHLFGSNNNCRFSTRQMHGIMGSTRQADSMHYRILSRVFGRKTIPAHRPSGDARMIQVCRGSHTRLLSGVQKPYTHQVTGGTYVRRGVVNTLSAVWYVG